MKKMVLTSIVVLAISLFCHSQPAVASPLSLSYDVTDLGTGLFDYNFFLTLDNADDSWDRGESWDWLTFGDSATNAPKKLGPYNPTRDPLLGFVGDMADLPVGPWTDYNYSSGGHNGPTLVNFNGGWMPTALNETLTWSGTYTEFVGQGDLLFSTLLNYAPEGFSGWPQYFPETCDGVEGVAEEDCSGEWVPARRVDNNVYGSNNVYFEVATLGKYTTSNAVPEPATMLLFGSGLFGMLFRRKFIA